jgi:uncharacterized damage-inducible protein DinB
MPAAAIQRLAYLCERIPDFIETIPDKEWYKQPSPQKWSKQEILGHLIDSATNNHHRFIRAQLEQNPSILYDQDKWNKVSQYQQLDRTQLLQFWTVYNKHLIEIMQRITPENLQRTCLTGESSPVTIKWLITDYVRHLEHHLKQIGFEID